MSIKRPPTAQVMFTGLCSDPPEATVADALVRVVGALIEQAGRPADGFTHMGQRLVEMEMGPALCHAVREDMETHLKQAVVTYRWGGAGDFETVMAMVRGPLVVVIWLGEAEHAQVTALSQWMRNANNRN